MSIATDREKGPSMKNATQPQTDRLPRHRFVLTGALAHATGLVALLLFAWPAFAQTNSLADRLPSDAWAYISWGGTASLKSVSGTNSVLRLWKDPSFSAFVENSIATVSHEGGPPQKFGGLTPEQTAELFSALENPAVAGFLNAHDDSRESNRSSVSFFLVYNATGKQALVDSLRHQRDAKAGATVQRSTVVIGGVTVEKRVSGGSPSYEGQTGPFYIVTDSQRAMEELLSRFAAASAPVVSFQQAADFPAACRELARPSILNALILPGRLQMPATQQNAAFDSRAFAKSMHVDRIRAACMSLSFEKETTRTRGVVIGDTSQESILNFVGDSGDSFATMRLASANSTIGSAKNDYAAIYNSLFNAVTAGMPSDKSPFLSAMVAFLTSSWGMPPDQFFSLFTGETATIYPDVAVDPSQNFYAFTIREPEKILHVLQHVFPGEKSSASQEDDVTYLTVTLPSSAMAGVSKSSSSTSLTPSAIYLAVTPNMLFASQHQDLVRDAVVRIHGTQASPLAADAAFQKARAMLPAKLSALSYTNYTRYNWQKFISTTEKKFNEQVQQAARNAKRAVPPRVDVFQRLDPAVLSRNLHFSIGGAWKDATGIYFDSYIQ